MLIEAGSNYFQSESLKHRITRHLPLECLRIANAREQLRSNLRYLKDSYGLRVYLGKQGPQDIADASFDKIGFMEACESTQFLTEEISKYPREFIDNCGIIAIRLVKNLKNKDKTVNGIANYGGNLYLSYPDCEGDELNREGAFKFTTHHELFHFSDENSRHGLKHRPTNRMLRWLYEPSWHALNSTAYIGEGAENGEEHPEYASPYAMTDESEDRADTAALLMLFPKIAWQRTTSNDIFAQKIQTIVYAMIKRSAGQMDTLFFNDLMNGEVGQGYWETEN
jgi:hypothetical protein